MILFTHSYFSRFDPKQWKMSQPYPPLATLYAASWMRNHGHKVSLFDTMFSEKAEDIIPVLEKENPEYLVIYDDGFNYLTKMCLTNMREAAFQMIKIAKARGSKVIVSSSDSTDNAARYLEEGADFIIKGEGEITLQELIESLESGKDFSMINGLIYKNGDELTKTLPRSLVTDLDMLGFPAWDLVNMEKYRQIWMDGNGYFSLNMVTTRGCPFKCNWCAKPIYGNRYHSRSPKHVAEELEFLLKNYQPEHIWFSDDIFGLKPVWAEEFADAVTEKNLQFRFKIQSRVDLLLKGNTLGALARAGCDIIWVGAESGSQKILDAMDKGTTIEQIKQATVEMKANGIKPAFFLQFGYPGEEKKDIDATLNMLLELMPYDIGISVSYPLPGTKFYENVKDSLKEKRNWTDSDELAMMFPGKFSATYYKKLHRYVHKIFRKKQGITALKQIASNPLKAGRKNIYRALSTAYYIPGSMFDKITLSKLENKNHSNA